MKELEERCVTVTKQESKDDYVRQNQKYQNTNFSGRNNTYFPADQKDLEVSITYMLVIGLTEQKVKGRIIITLFTCEAEMKRII